MIFFLWIQLSLWHPWSKWWGVCLKKSYKTWKGLHTTQNFKTECYPWSISGANSAQSYGGGIKEPCFDCVRFIYCDSNCGPLKQNQRPQFQKWWFYSWCLNLNLWHLNAKASALTSQLCSTLKKDRLVSLACANTKAGPAKTESIYQK
jgi:hypothetical protein